MSGDRSTWRGPFGMSAADIVVLVLSSILIFYVAIRLLIAK